MKEGQGTMAPTSPNAQATKAPRALACELCRRRKVKCDHNTPCSNCVLLNRPCIPTRPAPPARRRVKAELQSRLMHFEALLKQFQGASVDDSMQIEETGASGYEQHEDAFLGRGSAGYLIEHDKSTTYTTRTLWALVHQELQSMRTLVNTDSGSDTSCEQLHCVTPPDFIQEPTCIDGSAVTVGIESLYPSSAQSWDLWQIFLVRVHPLTKVIHGPTLQQSIDEFVYNPASLSSDMQALIFAVYCISAASMNESECQQMLHCSKVDAVQQFSVGLRIALSQAQFLKFPTLQSLQALTIYLISLQGRYNRDANWILNGVCIRIALKLGLHQDGELLGLSPFESEMRRRVWWQIMLLDVRFARASGLGLTLLPQAGHCKMPVNLNDSELDPDATEPFQNRNGPTEMIVCLLFYKLGQLMLDGQTCQELITYSEMIAMGSDPGNEVQLQRIQDLAQRIKTGLDDIMERFSDPSAGPLHELATQIKLAINEKTDALGRSPCEQPEWGYEILTPSDNLFKLSVVAIEQYVQYRDVLYNKGLLWSTLTSFHHDVFLYMVVQLCLRTSGSLVERAWTQIPIIYSRNCDLFDCEESTSLALAKYILKAWKIRQNVLRLRLKCLIETPDYIQKLQAATLRRQITQAIGFDCNTSSCSDNWLSG